MSAVVVIDAHRCRERGMVCDEGELWCDTCKAIINESDVSAHQVSQLKAAGYAVVKLPTVAHKGPLDTDAKFFRQVADRMDRATARVDYLSGNNVRFAVRQLLYRAADAAEQVIA